MLVSSSIVVEDAKRKSDTSALVIRLRPTFSHRGNGECIGRSASMIPFRPRRGVFTVRASAGRPKRCRDRLAGSLYRFYIPSSYYCVGVNVNHVCPLDSRFSGTFSLPPHHKMDSHHSSFFIKNDCRGSYYHW